MSSTTKITLSDKELSLVTDKELILTKHQIIGKVYQLFADRVPSVNKIMLNDEIALAPEIRSSMPKISKGENYLQLPYVMMDHPRCFDRENIFALRTMFWWGNFFSITLHVSGMYMEAVREKLTNNHSLIGPEFFIGINENQWEHHFEANNFLPYCELDPLMQKELLQQKDFIKLALKYDLTQWNKMQQLLDEGYQKIAALLF